MFVSMNFLQVPAEMKDRMQEMFGKSAERMKEVPGCLEFLFLDSVGEEKQVVFTKWESKEAFTAWTKSDHFKRAHAHAGKGENPSTGNKLEMFQVIHQF